MNVSEYLQFLLLWGRHESVRASSWAAGARTLARTSAGARILCYIKLNSSWKRVNSLPNMSKSKCKISFGTDCCSDAPHEGIARKTVQIEHRAATHLRSVWSERSDCIIHGKQHVLPLYTAALYVPVLLNLRNCFGPP